MRIGIQINKLLSVIVTLATVVHSSHSGALQPTLSPIEAWTTQRFKSGDVPCLPLNKTKAFLLQPNNNSDNAYMMMAASYLAYSFWPGKRARILTSWGFKNIHLFDDSPSSTNGYWAEHTEFVLLAFRGTQEPTDLLTDVDVELEQFDQSSEDLLVHKGFKRGADAVWTHVERAGQHAQVQQKPLFVTGHSLGGAIALLSAIRLKKQNIPLQTLWTFGAPKVGNNLFFESTRSLLKEKWQRINQESDPIPALPFTFEDEEPLRRWSSRLGPIVPVLRKFAHNANYDTAPIVYRDPLPELAQRPITHRKLSEIGLGFLKHLPRSYVCDLSTGKLKF